MKPKQNLMNIKSLIVHSLDSQAQAICNCDIYQKSHGYELTDNHVTCQSCLHLLNKRMNEQKDKPCEKQVNQRRQNYKFITTFKPINLLHDHGVAKSDRSKFHTWCMNNNIRLDKPMEMDKLLIEKLDSLACFRRWLTQFGYMKIEEVPVTIELTFSNSAQFNELINKIHFANMDPFQGSPIPYGPEFRGHMVGPMVRWHPSDEILEQLLKYQHLFRG